MRTNNYLHVLSTDLYVKTLGTFAKGSVVTILDRSAEVLDKGLCKVRVNYKEFFIDTALVEAVGINPVVYGG